MKYSAVIFDLDGVIVSTDMHHFQAWKALADDLGITFTQQDNRRLRGVSRRESLEILLEKSDVVYSENEKTRMAEQKNANYVRRLETMTPEDLGEEVMPTLEALRAGGVLLAVGSSSKNARRILQYLGLGNYFDAVADGTMLTHAKPSPEVFLLAARLLELPAGDCLVVEDAEAGLLAAVAGGMDCAAIGDAYGNPFATYGVSSFAQIQNLVLEVEEN